MSWDYRIVVEDRGTEEEWWSIRDVYYTEDGEIYAMSERGTSPIGNDLQDLEIDVGLMLEAFKKDIIIFDENFVFAECDFTIDDIEGEGTTSTY